MSSFPQIHFYPEQNGFLADVLRDQFQLENIKSALSPQELIELGSVYVNAKRINVNELVSAEDLIKVRLFPKRYDIKSLLFSPYFVFENKDFVVVDKPSPLPTHATADNLKENLLYLLESKYAKKFYVTSRLDAETEGLIILGKSPAAQSKINQLFRNSKIKKTYRALSLSAPPLGVHVHYQSPETSPKRQFSLELQKEWKRCELNVLSTRKTSRGFLSTIELLTGRTHQIRGQMELLSCPLVGDLIYGDNKTSAFLGLECYQLEIPWENESLKVSRVMSRLEIT